MEESRDGAWDDAVSEATSHVSDRVRARDEADARQRPRSEAPLIVVAVLTLAAVSAWNLRALTAPPGALPAPEERSGLSWLVVDAAEAVEDFLDGEGRLPTLGEASELLDDDVLYVVQPAGYRLSIDGQVARVEYSSATPLDLWLEASRDSLPEDLDR